ncbi:hypothetical protein BD770DRAFT_6992 [Pilaira anomala]|nr:hypothetical protein BD770DRAFT_6992 [Pilaira anomala]
MTRKQTRTVAIIGSGFSGICAFIQLKKELGIMATVFELNDDIGGTWLTSTYPGCACDVPSQLYSLSTELNPSWSEKFSSQKEIKSYLQRVCEKNKMYENTRFKSKVKSASWLDGQWQLKIEKEDGEIETVSFDFLFSGTGSLRIPHIPAIFKNFDGPVIHTGEWDASIEYKDKRIALVGSGSSACQIFPYLAKEASHLYLFQRSTPWIIPQVQETISSRKKAIYSIFPFLITLYRWFLILYYERMYSLLGYPNSNYAKSTSEKIWKSNRNYIIESARTDLVEKLEPDSPIGCRRIVFSRNFYETVVQDNVSLIKSPIQQIKGNLITTEDGSECQVDVIVLGTGYETQEGVLGELEIIGKEQGRSLTDLWKSKAPELYKSTMIHGFPNLFLLLGPYTLTGHLSVVLMAEIQVNYAIKCMRENQNTTIEPTKEAQDKYMSKLQKDFEGTIWQTSCSSWYKNRSGVITSLYPNHVTRFWWELGQFKRTDYVKSLTQDQ